jgi:predicted dehydrogenase
VTEPLRIGVVGCGNFGERHIAAYARRPDVKLVGVVDRDLNRARAVAQRWGIDRWFTETPEMLRECRPDGASIVTSGPNHVPPALAALAAGCCVLIEKPVAMSVAEADKLIDAERASTGFVMPAHILRFAGPHQELVGKVRNGEIGRILGVAAVRDRGRDHEHLFPDVHPALMTTIHDIDLALWITGSRAVRVTAHGRGEGRRFPLLVWAHVEAADGSIWTLRVSWLLPDNAPVSDRLEVYGTGGVVTLDLRPTVTLLTEEAVWVDHELTPDAHPGALDAEVACFCARLHSRSLAPVVTLGDARHGLEIAEGIMRSLEHGSVPTEVGS